MQSTNQSRRLIKDNFTYNGVIKREPGERENNVRVGEIMSRTEFEERFLKSGWKCQTKSLPQEVIEALEELNVPSELVEKTPLVIEVEDEVPEVVEAISSLNVSSSENDV